MRKNEQKALLKNFERHIFLDEDFEYKGSECWLWEGACDVAGYGRVAYDGHIDYAHRVAYKIYKGSIPYGSTIDHRCEVRNCVNPAHLKIVSRGINLALRNERRDARRVEELKAFLRELRSATRASKVTLPPKLLHQLNRLLRAKS